MDADTVINAANTGYSQLTFRDDFEVDALSNIW